MCRALCKDESFFQFFFLCICKFLCYSIGLSRLSWAHSSSVSLMTAQLMYRSLHRTFRRTFSDSWSDLLPSPVIR